MGQKWTEIFKEGNIAFEQEQYSLASVYYIQVLAEAKKNLKQLNLLSEDNLHVVTEFCLCTQYAVKATLKNGQLAKAETIYLEASEALSPLISNLNNRQIYRALTLTQFKTIFYDLADLYVSNRQMDKLILM